MKPVAKQQQPPWSPGLQLDPQVLPVYLLLRQLAVTYQIQCDSRAEWKLFLQGLLKTVEPDLQPLRSQWSRCERRVVILPQSLSKRHVAGQRVAMCHDVPSRSTARGCLCPRQTGSPAAAWAVGPGWGRTAEPHPGPPSGPRATTPASSPAGCRTKQQQWARQTDIRQAGHRPPVAPHWREAEQLQQLQQLQTAAPSLLPLVILACSHQAV